MTASPRLIPSCLVPEIYALWKDQPGFVAEQIERIAEEGFYRSVEISPVHLDTDRRRIRDICAEHNLYLSVWLTSVLEQKGLDLGCTDEAVRERSVEEVKRLLQTAVECGSKTIALVGGNDPGPALRERGYESCYRSLVAISAEASQLGASVMFEPLDRFAHKKRLVGPTKEAVALFARVREEAPGFGFAFDTAHAALNEEDVLESLELSKDQLVNVHLSNAVLDRNDPLYGDHHMMPGAPGFLTVAKAAEIIAKVRSILRTDVRIAVEARALNGSGEQVTARVALQFLRAALAESETMKLQEA